MSDPFSSPAPYDPGHADRVFELGRQGLGRAEIAADLGVALADLDAWSADHQAFAAALARAETESRAWWEAQPRLALMTGAPFRAAIWAKAVAQRYGRADHRPLKDAKPPTVDDRPEAIFEIPDNGHRRRPRKPRRQAGG